MLADNVHGHALRWIRATIWSCQVVLTPREPIPVSRQSLSEHPTTFAGIAAEHAAPCSSSRCVYARDIRYSHLPLLIVSSVVLWHCWSVSSIIGVNGHETIPPLGHRIRLWARFRHTSTDDQCDRALHSMHPDPITLLFSYPGRTRPRSPIHPCPNVQRHVSRLQPEHPIFPNLGLCVYARDGT